ncbi:hypothetical protein HDU76_010012, partial [Blyttiomyces sp. JEL0837]
MTAAMSNPQASPNHSAAAAAAAESVKHVKDESKVNCYEVGWLFVQEYYTFLNKEPHKLHCFYNSKSSFIHGTEGESPETQHGQKEIHNRIMQLDFQDCKVLVSNVDSQRSHDGSIVIMVLGEMSNKGGPSHKFCQCFVLAEQRSGYFVFNDMFRFLKEDIDNEYEEPVDPISDSGFVNGAHLNFNETTAYEEHPEVIQQESIPRPPRTPSPVREQRSAAKAVAPIAAPVVEAPAAPIESEYQAVVEESSWVEPAAAEPEPEKAPWAAVSKPATAPEPEVAKKPAVKETPVSTVSAPVANNASSTVTAPATPAPTGPPKPKTWANLAATNPQSWTADQVSPAKGAILHAQKPAGPNTHAAANGTQNRPQQQQQKQQPQQHQRKADDLTTSPNSQSFENQSGFREVQNRRGNDKRNNQNANNNGNQNNNNNNNQNNRNSKVT